MQVSSKGLRNMRNCISTKLDVSFIDKESHTYSECRTALFSHFATTPASIENNSLPTPYDESPLLLVKYLQRDVRICLLEVLDTQWNNTQERFTFEAVITSEKDELDIEEVVSEADRCISKRPRGTLLQIKRHRDTSFNVYPVAESLVLEKECAIPYKLYRPGLHHDGQPLRMRIAVVTFFAIVLICQIAQVFTWERDLTLTLFSLLAGSFISQIVTIVEIGVSKRVAINNESAFSAAQKIAFSSRTEKMANMYSEEAGFEQLHHNPKNDLNSLICSRDSREVNHKIKREN